MVKKVKERKGKESVSKNVRVWKMKNEKWKGLGKSKGLVKLVW